MLMVEGMKKFFSYFAVLLAVANNVFFKDPGNSTSAEKRGASAAVSATSAKALINLLASSNTAVPLD